MNNVLNWTSRTLAILIATTWAVGSALADPPEGKGKGKGKSEKAEYRQGANDQGHRESGGTVPGGRTHFADQHRVYVREYYGHEYSRGSCPPGLAKKNNGCMPPGQAKKWQTGRPLPRDVVFYELPPQLVVKIGAPPAGHRYVRVAADVLLIAVGTGIVIDAIVDLGRM